MPPKVKLKKENIIEASLNIVRSGGISKLNARALAKELKCSTHPIFGYYATMEELKADVIKAASKYCDEYLNERKKCRDVSPYKLSGLAYIQFAKDEKELFKLLFMSDKKDEQRWEDDHHYEIEMIMETAGFDQDTAKKFHLQMWLFVHGIATLFITSSLDISNELIDDLMTRTYLGALKMYEENKQEDNFNA